jgi:RNA polymerase sigma-70 factor, ECF subfamily
MMALTVDVAAVVEAGAEVGERSDFDEFYRREFAALSRLAFALCGRRDVAEELVQDAMVKVLARWWRVRGYDRPGAFARRIVVQQAVARHRRVSAESRALARLEPDETAAAERSDASFWSLVRRLPPRQLQCVALYYVDDCATGDIAALLGISEGTVRATLAQARGALRSQVETSEP